VVICFEAGMLSRLPGFDSHHRKKDYQCALKLKSLKWMTMLKFKTKAFLPHGG